MDNRCRALSVLFALYAGAVLASATLRVGNQVLTTGDSAARVTALLGKPLRKSRPHGARAAGHGRGGVRVITGHEGGEHWQYRRGDHVTTITIIDGRVDDIQDRRQ